MADILSDISQDPDIILHILDNYIGSAYSPQVAIEDIEGGNRLTITYDDADEGITSKTINVMDGEKGDDGYSPTVTITDTATGHTVTITDASGPHSYSVPNYASEESARQSAERARQSAETARDQAEGTRTQAESQRAENERQRAASEQSRATAETQRNRAEQARQTAEGERADAEQARAAAETQRVSNEFHRTSAETSRADAEDTRANEWATIKADAQAATAGAENVDATMTKSGSVATVTVTDRDGTAHTATLTDGVSPTASVQRVTGGAEITVTDASGTTTATLYDATIEAGSITDEMLAPDGIKAQVASMWGNRLTGEMAGTILTANDAYTAPPLAVGMGGSSTQDGTPTPDAPVEIRSVENPVLHVCGKNVCGTITDHPNGKRFFGYGINSSNRYPKLACNLPAGTYTLSMDVRSIDEMPIYGHIRMWVRDASDGLVYNLDSVDSGVKIEQIAHGNTLFANTDYYSVPIPTTYTHVSRVINIGFAVSEIIFGLYYSGQYIEYQNLQLELGSTATYYEPYVGVSATLPVTLRSLPDGTKDTLALTYLRPSTREGWAWYSGEVTRTVGAIFGSNLERYNASNGFVAYRAVAAMVLASRCRCSRSNVSESFDSANMTKECVQFTSLGSGTVYVAALENRSLDDFEYDYPLAIPTTETLDPIELPSVIGPSCTIYATADATPTLAVTYERDVTIAYENLLAAIADLATS